MTDELRVEEALEAAKYRVYPDTPISEVIDLMVRRGLRAVPVVGEQYEVLGIITIGDALREVIRDGTTEDAGADEAPRAARDVMTRAVLCVSETQPLADAARMMAHRSVDQLPVVRDGQLIGLVHREAVLRAMHGDADTSEERERDDK